MQDRNWRAKWWRPQDEHNAVWGELRFSNDAFRLELDGSLPREHPSHAPGSSIAGFFEPSVEPVLVGKTRKGEAITLLGNTGWVPSLPFGEVYETWTPRVGLVGLAIESPEGFTVRTARMQLNSLSEWAGVHSVDLSLTHEERLGRITRVEVSAERQELGHALVNGRTVRLVQDLQFTSRGPEAHVGLATYFEIELEAPAEPQGLIEELQPLRDLVTFATLRPANIEVMRIRPDEAGSDAWGELLIRLTRSAHPVEDRPVHHTDMLFSARELPSGFERGLNDWFRLHQRYSTVFQLLLGISYAPFIYDDQRFLAVTQAAEVFHRTSIGGTPLSKEDHRDRVKSVADQLGDPDLRDWTRQILQQSNYLHLRDRLRGLVAELGDIGKRLTGGDIEGFVARIVATRNFLTHREEERRTDKVLKSPDRFWHGQALTWMLRLLLMREFGWELGDLEDRLKHNSSLSNVLHAMESG